MFRLARSFVTSLFFPLLPQEKPATISLQHPFMQAVVQGNLPVLGKYTIYRDFDPNITDEHGNTPVILAAINNHLNVLRVLHNHGGDLNKTGENGVTALIVCAYDGNVNIITYLLEQGVDLEAAVGGNTALMWAVAENHVEVAAMLIRAGANVHATNVQGNTALHIAAEQGNAQIVGMLLNAGANPLAAGADNVTHAMVAEAWGHQQALNLMVPQQPADDGGIRPMDMDEDVVQAEAESEEDELEWPEHLLDAVSMEPFNDPVTILNGQTYSRATLQRLFDEANDDVVRCPLTRDLITRDMLTAKANIVIQDAVRAEKARLTEARKRQRDDAAGLVESGQGEGRLVRQKRLQHFGHLFAPRKEQNDVVKELPINGPVSP